MATQKNSKSSRPAAAKSKSSKAAPAKKSAPKPPVKGKQTSKSAPASKVKSAVKTAKSTKLKKAAPVSKKPLAKTAVKQVAKKKTPVKASVAKPKPSATKQGQRAPVKPAVASKAAPKAIVNTKAKTIPAAKANSSVAPKPVMKTQVKVATPKKPDVHVTPKSKEVVVKHQPSVPASQSKSTKVISKPVVHPQVTLPAKPQGKIVTVKPVVATNKPVVKPAGSKISDVVKPSVSSKPMAEPVKEQPKPKEFQRKSLKQSTVHAVKPFDTMSDKKENKPVGATYSDEPHKTRYNDKELEEFDQLIDQKLIVAREQLEFYLKQLEDMAENPDNKIKGLDDGLSTLESERVSSMAARQQKLIQHLENAKIRIKNKVYGICRETGRLISKERLRAVPHATLSIEAKQAQN